MFPTDRTVSYLFTLLFLIALALPGVVRPEPANSVTTLRADAVGHAQWLQTSDSETQFHNDPGMPTPLANLRARSEFDGGLVAFAELYFASRNPQDDAIEIGSFYGSTGSYFDDLTFAAGRFLIDYGLQGSHRSDHADVQNNALIGNPLVDPTDHQTGGGFTLDRSTYGITATLTNGSDRTNLNVDRGYGSLLKFSVNPHSSVNLAVSGYRAYHGDTTADPGSSNLTTDNLFGPEQSVDPSGALTELQTVQSEPYSEIDRGLGGRPDALTVGRDLEAWQVDLLLKVAPLEYLWAHYGSLKDDLSNLGGSFANSPSTVEWNYVGAEAKLPIREDLYLAGRWNRAEAETLADVSRIGVGMQDGTLERYQAGIGYRFSNNTLIKGEYVRSTEDVTTEEIEYEGITLEVSITGYPRIDAANLNSANGE